MRDELKAEREAHESTKAAFRAQIEREIKYELQGQLGRLAGKLQSVFDNADTCADDEPDAELCEFYRGWLSEVREKLSAFGVPIR